MANSFRLTLGEIFLIQLIIWLVIWISNPYVASLLTISIGIMVFAVLIIAIISELIERSKVPRNYFYVMAISILAILVSAGIYWAVEKTGWL